MENVAVSDGASTCVRHNELEGAIPFWDAREAPIGLGGGNGSTSTTGIRRRQTPRRLPELAEDELFDEGLGRTGWIGESVSVTGKRGDRCLDATCPCKCERQSDRQAVGWRAYRIEPDEE